MCQNGGGRPSGLPPLHCWPLRLLVLIEVEPAAVSIGMAVTVRFEDHGEVFVPVFAPA
jgi:hypothetical protein